jgi:hypothetical protein
MTSTPSPIPDVVPNPDVIPAKAGIPLPEVQIPAFAGMTLWWIASMTMTGGRI